MGSFCPVAGTRNPHRDCNFAEHVVETVPKSLRHSCRSELTRQGISLFGSPCRHGGRTISSALPSRRVGWRMASEDSRYRDGFWWFIVCCTRAICRSPFLGHVQPAIHHSQDLPELPEVLTLRGDQWNRFEERAD